MIKTQCKTCIWQRDSVGCFCSLGKLQKFPPSEIEYKSEDKSYEINRVCQWHRPVEWAAVQKDIYESIALETRLKCDFIILTNENSLIEDMLKTVDSIENQTYCSNKVIVALNNKYFPVDLLPFLKRKNISWQIEKFMEISREDVCVDRCVERLDGKFFVTVCAGHTFPANFISSLNNFVNEKMERFSILLPDEKNSFFVIHRKTFDILHGNNNDILVETSEKPVGPNFVDKVKFLAKENNNEDMIKKVVEIYHE